METDSRKVTEKFSGDKGLLGGNDVERQAAWAQAFKDKTILLSEEVLDVNTVDYATMNLVLAMAKFSSFDKQNTLHMVKAFWRTFWPHLHNLIKGHSEMQTAWWTLVEDQDTVLKNYADQNLELRAYRNFVTCCDGVTRAAWNTFYAERVAEDEAKIKEIQENNSKQPEAFSVDK